MNGEAAGDEQDRQARNQPPTDRIATIGITATADHVKGRPVRHTLNVSAQHGPGRRPGLWFTADAMPVAAQACGGHDREVTNRAMVSRWLAGYEAAWRAPGTDRLADLFAGDATYLQSPYEPPVNGLDAIRRMWNAQREGPGEVFTLATEIIAVDGPTAVVRAEVRYGDPLRQEYRDLWVIRLSQDGRCRWFEEWPFWPARSYSARDGRSQPASMPPGPPPAAGG
jgi:ketosteroid isomerase-like protein